MGKKNLKSYSPSLPLVPNSSPSRASRATTSIRFTRHSQAAPPPWHSGDKSPSTLDHFLSVALASFPLLLFLYLQDRPHWLSHARLGGGPSGYRLHWSRPLPGWLSVRPASARPAQPSLGFRQGAHRNPPAARGRVCRTHPLLSARRRFLADYASAPSQPGCARSDSGRGRGSRMAAAGSRRPNV